MAFANISRMSISRRQSKMSAVSERCLRSDVRSRYTFLLIKFSHPSSTLLHFCRARCPKRGERSTKGRDTREAGKKKRRMKDRVLTEEGKKEEGIRGELQDAWLFPSGSSPFHIFSPIAFHELRYCIICEFHKRKAKSLTFLLLSLAKSISILLFIRDSISRNF